MPPSPELRVSHPGFGLASDGQGVAGRGDTITCRATDGQCAVRNSAMKREPNTVRSNDQRCDDRGASKGVVVWANQT